MKKIILPILVAIIALLPSCKKCYVCSSDCQTCTVQGFPLQVCSSTFADEATYQQAILGFIAAGATCTGSTGGDVEICDDKTSADNFKKLYEDQGLSCKDK
jgi:hypothetical protein